MKAVIYHQSIRGKTQKYAEEIGNYLKEKGVDTNVKSIIHYEKQQMNNADIVLFGCWTNGILIALQHPDKEWVRWTKELEDLNCAKIGLFTTYIALTGRMFRKMRKHIDCPSENLKFELKSKNGKLSEDDKQKLDALLN